MYNIYFYRPTDRATFNLFGNEDNYQMAKVTGLDAADRTLITAKTTLQFGGVYNGWAVNDREIELEVKINGNIEANRNLLLDFIRKDELYQLFITTPAQRQFYIDVYISSIDYDISSNREKMIITMLAPYPYFSEVYIFNGESWEEQDSTLNYVYAMQSSVGDMVSGFQFPIELNTRKIHGKAILFSDESYAKYTPTRDGGLIALLSIWTDGTNIIELRNAATGQAMAFNVAGLTPQPIGSNRQGTLIYIDTRPTHKQIIIFEKIIPSDFDYLTPEEQEAIKKSWYKNGMDRLISGSEWITVKGGIENEIYITDRTARTTNHIISVIDEYEGI